MSPSETPPPAGRRQPQQATATILGRRVLSHASVYALAGVIGVVSLLAQVVALTRLLPRDQYGDLAILILFAGLATLIAGLGVSQGTTVSAFLGGDEEGLVEERAAKAQPTDNKGILATGFLLTLMNCALLTALVYAVAGPLSRLLTGDAEAASAVVWATLYGALAPAWRIVGAIPRFERRPKTYLAMQIGNHSASIGCASAFAAAGWGIAGAMAGLAVGRLVVLQLGLVLARHRFRRTFSREHVRTVMTRGWPYAGVVLGFFLSRNAELFVLSYYVDTEDVGTYHVAARLALLPGFAMSATLMAWGPVLRGPLRAAIEKQGKLPMVRGRLVTYYLILGVWCVIAGVLVGEVLVLIAPEDYGDAARLLPVLMVASVLHAGTILIFRMSVVKGGVRRLRRWAFASVVLLIGASVLVVPEYGAMGAAAVNAAVPAVGVAIMYVASRRGRDPLVLDFRQVAGILLVALALVGAGVLATLLPATPQTAVEVALLASFPVLLVLLRIIPRAEVWQLLRMLRPSAGNRVHKGELRENLMGRPAADIELLERAVRDQDAPTEIAASLGLSETEMHERLVAVLREISHTGQPSKADARIGAVLMIRTAQTKRDVRGYELSQNPDVKPLEVDRLSHAMLHLRGFRRRTWSQARARSVPREVTQPPASTMVG